MTVSLSLEALVSLLVALVTGVIWLHKELARINEKLERLVTHDLCAERRDRCPCVIQMHALEKTLEANNGAYHE